MPQQTQASSAAPPPLPDGFALDPQQAAPAATPNALPPLPDGYTLDTPKTYLPGREFGMDVARGMGLDADAIKKAEDSGGQVAGLQEIGSQVLHGLKGVLMDPLSPITGAATNFEDAVKSGSPGKIVGALSSILGAAEGTEKVPPKVGEIAANMLRDETGKVRPSAKVAASAGAALAGHAMGFPEAGIAGALLGPRLADMLIPSKEASVAKPISIRNSPYFDPAEYKAGRTGATTPTSVPAGNPTPFTKPVSTLADMNPSEGRPATWTNDVVRERAAWGDPDAIAQAQARGFGKIPLKYSTVETTPRSVTRFDEGGNPISSGGDNQGSGGDFAYRSRDVGESGVPADQRSHAHATASEEEAQGYMDSRGRMNQKPQQVVRYDLSKMKEGTDYIRVKREGQPDWIKMLRPVSEKDVQILHTQENAQ